MPKRFTFRKQKPSKQTFVVDLDIEGTAYRLAMDENTVHFLEDFAEEAKKADESAMSEEEIFGFLAGKIDQLLGVHASQDIFEGRPKNIVDMMDVFQYVCGEITRTANNLQR